MKIKSAIKKLAKSVVYNRILNVLLRRIIKPFSSVIPQKIRIRIPIVGISCCKLPNAKRLYLYTDRCDGYSDGIANRLYWGGLYAYEGETLQLFIKLLKYTDTFIDIGAYTGLYAIIAAIDNPNRNVYAFEPVPRIFNYLKRNVELNGLRNLQIDSSAITNYVGDTKLFVPSGSIPTESSTLQGFRKASETISVRALTIDSFVTINNISRVDLIKIDTEATEHWVLEGAKKVIKRDEPIIICEVLSGMTEKELHCVLDDLGYKYYLISHDGLIQKERIEGGNIKYKCMNYLFIMEKRLRQIIKEININIVE